MPRPHWSDHYRELGLEPQIRGVIRQWVKEHSLFIIIKGQAFEIEQDGNREQAVVDAMAKVLWRCMWVARMMEVEAGVPFHTTAPLAPPGTPPPAPVQAGVAPSPDGGGDPHTAPQGVVDIDTPTATPAPLRTPLRPPSTPDALEAEGGVVADRPGAPGVG